MKGGLVYSTRHGKMCPACGQPADRCKCAKKSQRAPSTPADGIVRVSRQTKGRKGKGVCLISGVPLSGNDLVDLARSLKQRCGSGGTVRDGIIEIQGDHRDVLVTELEKLGYRVKLAGG